MLAYRRLSHSDATVRHQSLVERFEDGFAAVRQLAAPGHSKAVSVASGVRLATTEQIEEKRRAVLGTIGDLIDPAGGLLVDRAVYDRRLGAALHEHLEILPADAGNDGTWWFLTLVVFPDLAIARWPEMQQARLMGDVRNALRRVWVRQEVLGDLMRSENALGEDELVGLFERGKLSRNPVLVQALARAVLSYRGHQPRSEVARELYKRGVALTGAQLLDLLPEGRVEETVMRQLGPAEQDAAKRLASD